MIFALNDFLTPICISCGIYVKLIISKKKLFSNRVGNVPNSTEKLTSPNGVTATSYFTFESATVDKTTKLNESNKSSHNIVVDGELKNDDTIANYTQNK